MVNVSKLRAKSVSTFVNSLRSQGSKRNYYSTLKRYFEFLNSELAKVPDRIDKKPNIDKMNALDEISLEYVKDAEQKALLGTIDYEDDLRRYRDEALISHAESSKKFKFRVIFRYLGANQIEFDKDFTKNITGKGRPVTAGVEMIPTPTQFDMLMDRINPVGRAGIVLMAKAGMRPDEVLIAKISDLDLDFEAQYLDSETHQEMSVQIAKLNIPTAKGGQPRVVFLIKEVEDELRAWLQRRSEYIEKLKKHPKYFDKNPDHSQIFPFGYSTMGSMWETALGKCEMDQRETITMRNRLVYRLHNLRKFFRTYGQWKNPDVAEALMGHQEGISKIYARMDKATELMVKGIQQAEPYLTSRRLRSTRDFDDLKKENDDLRFQMQELTKDIARVGEQAGKIWALENQIAELRSYLVPDGPVFKEEIEGLEKQVEELK